MSKLKIGVIISSTRPTRFGEVPANWILDKANERPEIDAELIDLRDFVYFASLMGVWLVATSVIVDMKKAG